MKYVLSSWKMYVTVAEAEALFTDIQAALLERFQAGEALPRVILCPPVIALVPLSKVADERVVRLGAQDCHWEAEGSYTGEISPRMLQGLAEYVMIGHSERRAVGDTDEIIARKVAAAVRHGLIPILLVGEDSPDEDAKGRTEARLRLGLSGVDLATAQVLVAYEPMWAIGRDDRASTGHIRRAVEHLKGVLGDLGAAEPAVLYGGSVNEDNVDELVRLDVLDGVGAGRASLDVARFLPIIERVAAAG